MRRIQGESRSRQRVLLALGAAALAALILIVGLSPHGTWARLFDSRTLEGVTFTTGELSLSPRDTRHVTVYGVQDTPVSDTRSIPQARCSAYSPARKAHDIEDLAGLAPTGVVIRDQCLLDAGASSLTVSGGDYVVITYSFTLTATGTNLRGYVIVEQAGNPMGSPYEFVGARMVPDDTENPTIAAMGPTGDARLPFHATGGPQKYVLHVVTRVAGNEKASPSGPSFLNSAWVPHYTVRAEQGDR